jgi:hypothetical protein
LLFPQSICLRAGTTNANMGLNRRRFLDAWTKTIKNLSRWRACMLGPLPY